MRQVLLEGGHIGYTQLWGTIIGNQSYPAAHYSCKPVWANGSSALRFYLENSDSFPDYPGALREFQIFIPLWFPLLLLLIAPVRWLIARPQYVPAFPVIADAKQSS